MRWVRAIVTLLLAAAAFWALDNRHGTFPALGRLLDPFTGFWQNGERSDAVPENLVLPGDIDPDTVHTSGIYVQRVVHVERISFDITNL